MSKTPRTEKEIIKTLGLSVQHALSSMKDFARQLETELANSEKKVFAYKTALEQSESELADARAEIKTLKINTRCDLDLLAADTVIMSKMQDEIERLTLLSQNQETVIAAQRRNATAKDKLIEKLTESLKIVKSRMLKTGDFYALDDVNAALSAAERGE